MNISSCQPRVSASELPPERLANNSALTQQQKIAEASRQFEAVLLRQILDSTQKTVIRSEFTDNSSSASIYRDMITNQLAESISKSGAFGLAKTFEHQLSACHGKQAAGKDAAPPAPDATPASGKDALSPSGRTRVRNCYSTHHP
ncbi:MAG TPA: rod-binding protein [Candidatus Sulfotelmatobacter sp.]|nr:rod-binding protein [Candidatus Sulfotelmatobacter sp.]HWI57389.1 rod-binding protein [Bacillota bacterium]